MDGQADPNEGTAWLRQLRLSIDDWQEPAPAGWPDDLRLFLMAWAAGFVFFLILIA